MDTPHETEVNTVKRASQLGVKEDILHVSLLDEGHDLRYAPNINQKQKVDDTQNA